MPFPPFARTVPNKFHKTLADLQECMRAGLSRLYPKPGVVLEETGSQKDARLDQSLKRM